MKIQEYQVKSIFSKFNIPIPRGQVALNASFVRQIAEDLGGKVVVKAQVLVGGRGKAGGIRLANDIDQAEEIATEMMGMEIKGLPIHKVLVEQAVDIERELYLGIATDRMDAVPVMIASSYGGVDIEEAAEEAPEKITYIQINPLVGLCDFQIRCLAVSIDLPREYWRTFEKIARALWEIYETNDASLVEINPLVISEGNGLIALDGKMTVDDNALFRHPELADLRDLDMEDSYEIEAQKYGISYIHMNGNIGCLVNGAGLAMATMDILKLKGGEPANFLDIGGGAGAEKVSSAFRILLSDSQVKAILVNVFGGITRCDEIARGITSAIAEQKGSEIPIVIRLVGTNAEEGYQILEKHQFPVSLSLTDAAEKTIALAGVNKK
ncbi:MAG: Succinyl-CoA ligase [ADP-forming] subunit beta [Anaerolinea thermophila]|uniref:Succinate--CoA ligase [ADP-forming] subunit beta n=1 Tax=Anaerolinea thermophila TaxID=167964 RepID=A0A101FYZ5_9CHLR|nr:MAG: Succinyl-CoA ligase [ADP-forming] subunit beta [Anaerolinea thermophila]